MDFIDVLMILVAIYVVCKIVELIDHHEQKVSAEEQKQQRLEQQLQDGIAYVDSLSGDQFEIYMTKLLRLIGFKNVKHTPFAHDYGLDAIGYLPNGKATIGFQFKNYKKNVPYHAVEETIGGSRAFGTKYNVVVTNSGYTRNTLKGVKMIQINDLKYNIQRNLVSLCDRQGLIDWIKLAKTKKQLPVDYNPITNDQYLLKFSNNN